MNRIKLHSLPAFGRVSLALGAFTFFGLALCGDQTDAPPTATPPVLREEARTQRTTVDQLDERLVSLRGELRTDQVEIGTMKERLVAVHKEIEMLRGEMSQVTDDLRSIREESKQVKERNQQLRLENQQLRKLLALQGRSETNPAQQSK